MRHLYNVILFTLLSLLVISSFFCGGNPFEEGQKAFEKGEYNLALKYLSEARKEQPKNPAISEKIALCYMMRGKELFEKTKNIKSFHGNFTRGEEFIPDLLSAEFQNLYSDLLFTLANAYINTKPENDLQREEYLNKSIASLENSLGYNPNNTESENLLNKIKADNFAAMLEKGKSLFVQAKKQRNNDLYFAAEYYFKKANKFNPENKEAKVYLSKTRAQTLDVPDIQQDLAMAIGDQNYTKGSFLMYVEVQNNISESVNIKHENFKLVDKSGKTYSLDKAMMKKLKKDILLPEKSLGNRKSMGGIIAFKMKKKVKIDYLEYDLGDEKKTKKYFP